MASSGKHESSGGNGSARELVEPSPGDKRFVRRDAKGKFTGSDDVGRSLSQDVRTQAKTSVKSGQGDKGDRAR